MLKKFRNDGGFTLTELLVAVSILGIIAAIAVPVYLSQQRTSRDAAVKSDINSTLVLMHQERLDGLYSSELPDPAFLKLSPGVFVEAHTSGDRAKLCVQGYHQASTERIWHVRSDTKRTVSGECPAYG